MYLKYQHPSNCVSADITYFETIELWAESQISLLLCLIHKEKLDLCLSVCLFIKNIKILSAAVKCKTKKIDKILGMSSFFEVKKKEKKK